MPRCKIGLASALSPQHKVKPIPHASKAAEEALFWRAKRRRRRERPKPHEKCNTAGRRRGPLGLFLLHGTFCGKKNMSLPLLPTFFAAQTAKFISTYERAVRSESAAAAVVMNHFLPPIPCSASAFTPIHHLKEGEEPSWVCTHLPTSDG